LRAGGRATYRQALWLSPHKYFPTPDYYGDHVDKYIGAAERLERLEYTAIGDTVNMASRMGSIGAYDQVLLTRPVFDTLGEGFEFGSIWTRQWNTGARPFHYALTMRNTGET